MNPPQPLKTLLDRVDGARAVTRLTLRPYASSWREYLLRYGLLAIASPPYSEGSRLFLIADYAGLPRYRRCRAAPEHLERSHHRTIIAPDT